MHALSLALAAILGLAACRSTGSDAAFEVHALVLTAPESLAEGLRGSSAVHVVPSTRVAALRLAPGAEVVCEPTLRTREGQRAEVADAHTVEYVQDARLGAGGRVETIPGRSEEGVWIAVTPERADRGRIALAFEVRTSDVLRPMRESTVRPAGADRDVTIQLPDVDVHRCESRGKVGPGESVVIVLDAPATETERRVCIVALTCEPAGPSDAR